MSGKGDGWRKGTDFDKYRNSPYWTNRKKDSNTQSTTVAKLSSRKRDSAQLVVS